MTRCPAVIEDEELPRAQQDCGGRARRSGFALAKGRWVDRVRRGPQTAGGVGAELLSQRGSALLSPDNQDAAAVRT